MAKNGRPKDAMWQYFIEITRTTNCLLSRKIRKSRKIVNIKFSKV